MLLGEWETQRISVSDHFCVTAPISVWTRNLHPKQQSGFHRRVIAVKPLLTGWCGSQRLVKCNVPQDSILAIALLHWDSWLFCFVILFLLACPHSYFSFSAPPPPHTSFALCLFIVFLSHFRPCLLVLLSPLRLPLWCCAKYFWLNAAYMQNANYGEIRCSTI